MEQAQEARQRAPCSVRCLYVAGGRGWSRGVAPGSPRPQQNPQKLIFDPLAISTDANENCLVPGEARATLAPSKSKLRPPPLPTPRPMLAPPSLGLPACDSRYLPSFCDLAARSLRRTPFSTRPPPNYLRDFCLCLNPPVPSTHGSQGDTHRAEVRAEARPPLPRTGQPRSIRHPAVGSGLASGLASRPARPLRLPLPGAEATAPQHFKARLYLAFHLLGPPSRLGRPSPTARPPGRGLEHRRGPLPPLLWAAHLPSPTGQSGFSCPAGKRAASGAPGLSQQVKLLPSANATGGTGPSPSAPALPRPAESADDFGRPALAHLLLPDSTAWGQSPVGRREREGRSRGRAEDPKPGAAWPGRRCPRPLYPGPPQRQRPERVLVPSGRGGPRLTARGDAGSTAALGLRRVPHAPQDARSA